MDKKMSKMFSSHKAEMSFVHGTISAVLQAIDRNGLEKTLEDLRKTCKGAPECPEGAYRGMLGGCLVVSIAFGAISEDEVVEIAKTVLQQ